MLQNVTQRFGPERILWNDPSNRNGTRSLEPGMLGVFEGVE